MKTPLRDYQQEAIQNVQSYLSRGVYSGIVHFATGLGKTLTAFGMYEQLFKPENKRCLFVAPSRALIFQTAAVARHELQSDSLDKYTYHCNTSVLKVGVIMGNINQVDARFLVGSAQTLVDSDSDLTSDDFPKMEWTFFKGVASSEKIISTRLDQALQYGIPDVVMFDEAHHAVADRTLDMARRLDRLRKHLKLAPLIIIGFTATPVRHDGRGLNNLFDAIYDRRDFRFGQKKGYLVPFAKPIAVKLRDGNNNAVRLSEANDVLEQVYKSYRDICQGRYCVGFTGKHAQMSGVELSKALTRYFQSHGVRAAHTDGQTCIHLDGSERSADTRSEIYQQFMRGEVDVLWSYGVGIEGLDLPRADCLLWLRSTDNSVLRTQAVGRILRPFAGKKDALIVDFTGRDIELTPIGTLAGYRIDAERGEYVEDAEEQDEELQVSTPLLRESPLRAIDALVYESAKIIAKQPNDWYEHDDGSMTLSVSLTTSLMILPPNPVRAAFVRKHLREVENALAREGEVVAHDFYEKLLSRSEDELLKMEQYFEWLSTFYSDYTLWHVRIENYRADLHHKEIVMHNNDLHQLLLDVPLYIANNVPDAVDQFVKRNQKWKKSTLATPAQQRMLRSLKIDAPADLSAGRASQLINYGIIAPLIHSLRQKADKLLEHLTK